MNLPSRNRDDEDAFIARFMDATDADRIAVIEAAMEAKRPSLAARILTLLDDNDPVDASAHLSQAKRAAKLFLRTQSPDDALAATLYHAWANVRRGRIRDIKQRSRNRNSLHPKTLPRGRKKR
jgi:hypothetical protein